MWRVIRLVAGGALVIALGVAGLMAWPLLWPPDPDAAVKLVSGRMLGETTGYVGRVDRDFQIVDVSTSVFGWRPIALTVNGETAIVVQGRQGGFGDLVKDLPVRVVYELAGNRRLATTIEVAPADGRKVRPTLADSAKRQVEPSPPASVGISTPAPTAGPAPVARPSATDVRRSPPRAEAPSASPPADTAPPAAAAVRVPSSRPPATAVAPAVETAPARPSDAPRAATPVTASSGVAGPRSDASPRGDSRPPAPVPSPPGRQGPASRPSEPDSSDGTAAVEWLLNRGR
jgi:hypothetical protein